MKFNFLNLKKLRIYNAYFVSTISISFVLLMLGLILLIFFNVKHIFLKAKENIQLTVIIKPDIPEGQILMFQKQLEQQKFSNWTEYISKDQGLEQMKSILGSDFVDILDYNPLPPIINVYLNPRYSSFDSIEVIAKRIMQNDIVDDVFYYKSLMYSLSSSLRTISLILSIVLILFVLIALTLLGNTIRLTLYSKRHELATMRLIGATTWFIAKPFIVNAIIQGLVAGLLASAIIVMSLAYIELKSEFGFKIYNLELTIGIILLTGILLTIVSSFFIVRQYVFSKDI